MLEISPLFIMAVLLAQFVIAQHIGLQKLNSLQEAIGVGATIILSTIIASIFDELLLHIVLRPFDIVYLRFFASLTFTAALAPLIETLLRSHYSRWLPASGNFIPLSMSTCCTLIAIQIAHTPDAAFLNAIFGAAGLSFTAVFLLLLLQGLRERTAKKTSPLISATREILNATFIFIALCGITSIWQ